MTAMTAPASYFATRLDEIKEELARRGSGEIFDFGVGDPVEPTPSFIRQALIEALDPVSQYPTVVGQRKLRQAIAGWAERRLGIALDPDRQVLPASGSKEAIFHLPLALLGPDERRRRIVYPSPSYPVYEGSARYANAIAHPVVLREENGFRLDLRSLGRAVLEETRIAWLNYPHNPSGASVDLAYLQEQVEVARDYDILLCGDDCYLDLYFPNEPPPPGILQITQTGVLSVGSLSKRSGMTGYRSGYIAGDASVIAVLKKARPNFGVASPNFVQAAAAAAWSDDAHVAERRAIFGAKRARLVSFLAGRGYTVTGSQGAIYVWSRVPDGPGPRFFEKLLERGIVVSPGESFGAGGEGFFRLALVPTLAEIDRALSVWETISL
jgi:succinyldiaminopimelate transaminase